MDQRSGQRETIKFHLKKQDVNSCFLSLQERRRTYIRFCPIFGQKPWIYIVYYSFWLVLYSLSYRMPKRRTLVNTKVVPKAAKGLKTSAFLLTIVPNKVTLNPDSEAYKLMESKLVKLGDFILKKRILLKLLKFPEREGEPIRTYEENVELIETINEDRTAAVEMKRSGVLHLHIYFEFKHRTFLQLDRDKIELVASKALGIPKERLHINIRSQGTNSFRSYVLKYANVNPSADVQ